MEEKKKKVKKKKFRKWLENDGNWRVVKLIFMVIGLLGVAGGVCYSYKIYQKFTTIVTKIETNTQNIEHNYNQEVEPFFKNIEEYLNNMSSSTKIISDYAIKKMDSEN